MNQFFFIFVPMVYNCHDINIISRRASWLSRSGYIIMKFRTPWSQISKSRGGTNVLRVHFSPSPWCQISGFRHLLRHCDAWSADPDIWCPNVISVMDQRIKPFSSLWSPGCHELDQMIQFYCPATVVPCSDDPLSLLDEQLVPVLQNCPASWSGLGL